MYLPDWERLVESGSLLNRDFEIVTNDGRYTKRGPITSVHLDGDYLVVTVAWWAYRHEVNGEMVWTREVFHKTVRLSVACAPPGHWEQPRAVQYGSHAFGFRGEQLQLDQIPFEFHIEAIIHNQNIYDGVDVFTRFKQLAMTRMNEPPNALRNEDVTEWGLFFVIVADSLKVAKQQVRELCTAGGVTPTRLRKTRLLPGY